MEMWGVGEGVDGDVRVLVRVWEVTQVTKWMTTGSEGESGEGGGGKRSGVECDGGGTCMDKALTMRMSWKYLVVLHS